MVELAGGVPVSIHASLTKGFKITPEDIEKNMSKGVKAILLNYPCNPTGASYTREELEDLAKIIKKHNLIVHNMRIRNDYISYLICGMLRMSQQLNEIDTLNNNVKEYIEFFQDQFQDLNRASKI